MVRLRVRLGCLDQLLHLREVTGAYGPGRQKVTHEGGNITIEQPLGQLPDHHPADLRLGHGRLVEELARAAPVGNDAPLLQPGEEGGDGGLCETPFRPQRFPYLRHTRYPFFPKDAHDGDLEISELMEFGHSILGSGFVRIYGRSITRVVTSFKPRL